ncbi:twin-arginine translocase subunit TatC [Tundrisphaera sp. TA3]|uniref:twin-arginine translocase subunit TatC n=1 Tax=Tundrisphaera sp. TA3 TaxID=3435775 RepID=UPI003EBB38FF
MPTDKDLFAEEQTMVSMSFGDHIEELRIRLVLGLIGLFVGMIITFIPLPYFGQSIGLWIMETMSLPAQRTLEEFYSEQAERDAEKARAENSFSAPVLTKIPGDVMVSEFLKIAPGLKPYLPQPEAVKGKLVELPLSSELGAQILGDQGRLHRNALVSLHPLETVTIYLMISMVAGLVITSPWVFYQAWAFVGAGLYRHERHYVVKFLPFSLGLFLAGVFLCFFGVLPMTLSFLLQFNVWLKIEPTIRLTDWMSFATILPLVFGLAFQTPLVMLFVERIGILSADDFRAKRKIAIVVIVALAAILTPGPDWISQLALAIPMIALYEVGILLMGTNKKAGTPAVIS